MMRGFRKRQEQKANELLYLAWHTEALSRIDPLPKLEDLIRPSGTPPRRQQSDEDMIARIRVLNRMFGGDEIEV